MQTNRSLSQGSPARSLGFHERVKYNDLLVCTLSGDEAATEITLGRLKLPFNVCSDIYRICKPGNLSIIVVVWP